MEDCVAIKVECAWYKNRPILELLAIEKIEVKRQDEEIKGSDRISC